MIKDAECECVISQFAVMKQMAVVVISTISGLDNQKTLLNNQRDHHHHPLFLKKNQSYQILLIRFGCHVLGTPPSAIDRRPADRRSQSEDRSPTKSSGSSDEPKPSGKDFMRSHAKT